MFASIPTPTISVVEIGPLTIHFYALCIIAGVTIAIWLGNRLFLQSFPSAKGVVGDVAIAAVPAGVLGGRLYHVITTPENFFGSSGHPANILKIWEGGLGIWGAITLGGVAAFIAYRAIAQRQELPRFRYFADALAPGIIFAQAIGRWGNWFNAELFGKPTDLPWGLAIPQWARPDGYQDFATFHPTFLYESLWCAAVGLTLLRLRKKVAPGQLFAIYVALYCLGRVFFEYLRIDSAHHILGLRINIFVAVIVGTLSMAAFQRLASGKGRV
jgi:prolipoprotein diacylglyceryl transferase